MLAAGLERMAIRYPLAGIAGYAAFLALVRLWVALRRREFEPYEDFHVPDVPLHSPSGDPTPDAVLFGGGRGGGGGGGAAWCGDADGVDAPDVADAVPADAGEFWPVALLTAAVLSGALAVLYTIYIAPLLLAEVIVDAAVVAGVYRRIQRQDAVHWTTSVVRRTWVAASCLVLFLTAAGFALQRIDPSARSIGSVLRNLGS